MQMRLIALCLGFCLDLIFGDPYNMPHIIRYVGNLICSLENFLRKAYPKDDESEFWAGVVLVVLVSFSSVGFIIVIRLMLNLVSVYLTLLFDTFICYQLLATKALQDESMKVYNKLVESDLKGARHAVSMIVGRDTNCLDEIGVAKATIETVAENTSDGVIAPIIFIAIGGAPLGLFYKVCNTMDSMVGYKNQKYMFFGRFAAIWDDILNFIPARISGFMMCISAYISGFDGKGAFKIFFRDRKNHKSPNSAHTEAACAGALGIELGGSNYYFGSLVEKPTIGDKTREVEYEDIPRSCRLMYFTAILSIIIIIFINYYL